MSRHIFKMNFQTIIFKGVSAIVALIGVLFLAGCSKNEITVANAGSKPWHGIEVSAGGHVFVIETLEAGAFKTFDFDSMHEGGGFIAVSSEGEKQGQAFGYYTPNLTSEVVLILGDRTDGIEVVDMESTVQTIENLVAEKSKEGHTAHGHLQVLGEELAPENP
jgi:hypothetical protein